MIAGIGMLLLPSIINRCGGNASVKGCCAAVLNRMKQMKVLKDSGSRGLLSGQGTLRGR
jgi:hypothetical protein